MFTATEAETDLYQQVLKKAGYRTRIVTGVPCLGPQRVFINKHYDDGTPILSLDDDVLSLHEVDHNKQLQPFSKTIDQLATKGFTLCEKTGARLWGINPVANGFYMDQTITIGLRLVCGTCFGSYAHDPVWTGADRLDFSSGEDWESSFRSFLRYKGIIRFDGICPKQNMWGPGGMQDEIGSKEERNKDHTRRLNEIARRYSKFAKIYMKANNVTNIKLRRITHQKLKWR